MAANKKMVVDKQTLQDVKDMVESNMTQRQIAEYYSVSQNTISRYCSDNDIISKLSGGGGKPPRIIEKNRLLEVYNNGDMSVIQKSKVLGIAQGTMYDNLAYYNIQLLKDKSDNYYLKNTPPETDDEIMTILRSKSCDYAKKCSKLNIKLPTLYSLYDKYSLKRPAQLESLMKEFNRVNIHIEPQTKLIDTLSEQYKQKELERKETMIAAIKEITDERNILIEKEPELQIDNVPKMDISTNDTQKVNSLTINITLNFNINEANFNIKEVLKDSINATLEQVLNR